MGIHSCVVVAFLVVDVGMFMWGAVLLAGMTRECPNNEPHNLFLQVYVGVFALVFLAVAGLMVSLWLETKIITVLGEDERQALPGEDKEGH